MDDVVLRAMAKWPNVPAAYGWLGLDRRGNWSIKGERIGNPAVVEFIGRNYAHDERGRWFFQNGPQRVYVTLEYTPYVLRTTPTAVGPALTMHTGDTVRAPASAWLDDRGGLLVAFERTVGVLHDQDLTELVSTLVDSRGAPLSDALLEETMAGAMRAGLGVYLATGAVPLSRIESAEVARRFAFEPQPRPAPGEPEC